MWWCILLAKIMLCTILLAQENIMICIRPRECCDLYMMNFFHLYDELFSFMPNAGISLRTILLICCDFFSSHSRRTLLHSNRQETILWALPAASLHSTTRYVIFLLTSFGRACSMVAMCMYGFAKSRPASLHTHISCIYAHISHAKTKNQKNGMNLTWRESLINGLVRKRVFFAARTVWWAKKMQKSWWLMQL